MKILKFCAWSILLSNFFMFNFFMFNGWFVVAGMFPLYPPSADAAAIAQIFEQDATRIKIGCIMIWLGCGFYLPFIGLVSAQIRKVAHPAADTLSLTQLLAGTGLLIFISVPTILWVTAAFRPDRAFETTQFMNDAAWIGLIAPFWPPAVQFLCVGVAAFVDKSVNPVFPRWLGYFSCWVALLVLGSTLLPFFKTGPFAWNGIIGFWVPAVAAGIFGLCMIYVLLKAIGRQHAEMNSA